MRGRCAKAEVGYTLLIVGRKPAFVQRQGKIVENIYGINLVLYMVFESPLTLSAPRENDVKQGRCQQHDSARTKCRPAHAALKGSLKRRMFGPLPCGKHEQGDVKHQDSCHSGYEIIEQFHCLVRVGRCQIQKHIHCNYAAAIQVNKHHLEGRKEYKREQKPHQAARFARKRHEPHIERQRQHDANHVGRQRNGVGKSQ